MTDVVLLGGGYWGNNFLRSLLRVKGIQKIYCVEPREDRREVLAQRYQSVTVQERVGDLLEDPEVKGAIIATPASTHYAIAKQWINAGKHVLVEKPVALSTEDVEDLVARSQEKGVAIVPGHTYLFHGGLQFLERFVADGELGRLLWLSSARLGPGIIRSDVNVLWDLGPHDAAVLVHLFDPEITACHMHGVGRNVDVRVKSCTATMTTSAGQAISWNLSWRWPLKTRRIEIAGSQNAVLWDDTDRQRPLRIYRSDILDGHVGYGAEQVWVPTVDRTEPLMRECEHFLEVVNGTAAPKVDPSHILKVTSLLERFTQSGRM